MPIRISSREVERIRLPALTTPMQISRASEASGTAPFAVSASSSMRKTVYVRVRSFPPVAFRMNGWSLKMTPFVAVGSGMPPAAGAATSSASVFFRN